ncbi:MAG: hypothetical protein LBM13_06595 [Candidatus Ancillula sp.]|jgi:uncharacterized membrane protein|nr:hypothetical protein [Candidatus Ancillula sp.]
MLKGRLNIKLNKYYLGLFAISLLVTLPYWINFGFVPNGTDLPFHLGSRYFAALEGFKDGQIIPQVNPLQNNGQGFGALIFYGPTVSYIFALVYSIIPNLYVVLTLMVIVQVFFCGFSMYKLVKYCWNNPRMAFFAGVFYIANPWMTSCLYRSGQYGSLTAMIFIPLVILAIFRIYRHERGALLLSISASLIVTSHMLSVWITGLLCLLIFFLKIRSLDKYVLTNFVKAILGAVGFCAFFTLPMIMAYHSGIYNISRPSNEFSMTKIGSFIGGTMHYLDPWNQDSSALLFYPVFVCLICQIIFAIIIKIKGKKIFQNQFLILAVILEIISLILSSSYLPWRKMPSVFLIVQFPSRYLIIFFLVNSILMAILLDKIYKWLKSHRKTKKIYSVKLLSFVILAILTFGFALPLGVEAIKQTALDNTKVLQEFGSENSVWNEYQNVSNSQSVEKLKQGGIVPEYFAYPINAKAQATILAQIPDKPALNPFINNYKKNGTHITFSVKSFGKNPDQVTNIKLPVLYYDGYQAQDESGKKLQVNNQNGYVQVVVPSMYSGQIKVHFGMSVWTSIGFGITLLSFAITLSWFLLRKILTIRKTRKNKK